MKKRLLPLLLVLPLLASCGGSEEDIPEMDENYTPNLPAYKNKNAGEMKKEGGFAYLDLYEISDFHGAVASGEKELGIEKLSSFMDEERKNNPGGTVLLSGGDMWQGSADSNLTKGNLVTYSMNVMNFDAMTMGNHEFDWGEKWINNNKNRATFPLLAANIVKKGTSETADFVQKSVVVERGGYKIGIVGTIGDNIKNTIIATAVEGYDFANELETVKAEAAALRAGGCDVVVWSAHNDAATLATKSVGKDLGVNAVFGGHSHSAYAQSNGDGIPFAQTEAYSHTIAHVTLKIDEATKEVSAVSNAIIANPVAQSGSLSADQDIKMIYDQYAEKFITPVKTKRVGEVNAKMNATKELANFAVHSMVEATKKTEQFKDLEIAASFHNANGGVRKDIEKGEVLYGSVYEAFPFDNEIVILKLKGSTLIDDMINGNNNRAVWHSIAKNEIKGSSEYNVLTTDFLLLNADFYAGIKAEVTYTGIMVRDAVARQIKDESTVDVSNYAMTKTEYKF